MKDDPASTLAAGAPRERVRATEPFVSADTPDWSREAKAFWRWDPARSLLASMRAHQRASASSGPGGFVRRRIAALRHRFWSIVTGADIPLGSRIDGGLLLPHPNGIVIHPDAEIGPNCLLFQQVTIGANDRGVPRIGGHVDIGSGAKVLGPVTIGHHARIGANAVVINDVPGGATAAGVPARVFRT
jgi:serine O-acetyltransferase